MKERRVPQVPTDRKGAQGGALRSKTGSKRRESVARIEHQRGGGSRINRENVNAGHDQAKFKQERIPCADEEGEETCMESPPSVLTWTLRAGGGGEVFPKSSRINCSPQTGRKGEGREVRH